MIPYCNAHGIGLIPWSPLQAGDLAHPPTDSTTRREAAKGSPFEKKHSDADLTIISRVEEIASKRGWKMSEVALAWIDKKVSSPLVGCSSVRHATLSFGSLTNRSIVSPSDSNLLSFAARY